MIKILTVLTVLTEAIICLFTGVIDGIADVWIPVVMFVGLYVAWALIYVLTICVIALCIDKKKPCDKVNPVCKFFVDITVEAVMQIFGIKFEVEGKETIPSDRRFLLVSNHRSAADPFAVITQLAKYRLALISKPENFKIPLAGAFVHKCCYLPIDRENARVAMRTLQRATEFIKNDVTSIGVYPEGTRSKTGELLEFKDGVFYIAKRAECPIVVMTVENTEKVFKNLFKPKLTVKMKILAVLEPESFAEKTTHEISEEVHNMMLLELGK